MYKTVEHKTFEELLIDAFKAQLSTYDALLAVKDSQVDFLEVQIKGLKLELEQYKNKYQDSTGLTAKEREEIAKLSKEIMEEEPHATIVIDDKVLKEAMLRGLGLKVTSEENTTTANSDVDLNETGVVYSKGIGVKFY